MTATAAVRRFDHVPALDGLRGVAVLLVIISHTPLLVGYTGVTAIDKFIRGGFLGVDVFFVLSGFLITALLLREQSATGSVRFGNFYLRRALRLLPALYVLLIAHYIYASITHLPLGSERSADLSAVLYVFNWRAVLNPTEATTHLGHLWSLAVEEQFYLVWPAVLILFLSLRRSTTLVTTVLVTAIVGVAVHRALLFADQHIGYPESFIRTDTRIDSLLVGVLLACLWVRRRTPTRGLAWIGSAAALGMFICVAELTPDGRAIYYGVFTLFAVLTAIVLLAAVDGRWWGTRVLEAGPLRLVGRVSYGLYLWHFVIFDVVSRYDAQWSNAKRLVVGYGLTVVVTAASWQLVERPAMRLKARFALRTRTLRGPDDEATGAGPVPEPRHGRPAGPTAIVTDRRDPEAIPETKTEIT